MKLLILSLAIALAYTQANATERGPMPDWYWLNIDVWSEGEHSFGVDDNKNGTISIGAFEHGKDKLLAETTCPDRGEALDKCMSKFQLSLKKGRQKCSVFQSDLDAVTAASGSYEITVDEFCNL